MINLVGAVLYAIYNACMIIILLNMLIAMMSKSFDEIQSDQLEEWKFSRAVLWMVYIEHESALPVPFNLFPHPKSIMRGLRRLLQFFGVCQPRLKRKGGIRRKHTVICSY